MSKIFWEQLLMWIMCELMFAYVRLFIWSDCLTRFFDICFENLFSCIIVIMKTMIMNKPFIRSV